MLKTAQGRIVLGGAPRKMTDPRSPFLRTLEAWLKFYGVAAVAASWAFAVVILAGSTYHGIRYGDYSFTVNTNAYGENYIELGLVLLGAPLVVWLLDWTASGMAARLSSAPRKD